MGSRELTEGRAFLARRRGGETLGRERDVGRRGGALKTSWTKPLPDAGLWGLNDRWSRRGDRTWHDTVEIGGVPLDAPQTHRVMGLLVVTLTAGESRPLL